ncbi:asparagine synthase-related protein [Pseudoalteromonas tunicata]|uniref:asparagine synthase-related protein n=1 Tax=Pseudoalteromonas tunicata TaxID=314281 RepID=UPI00273D2E85|nr:asparagine synthase-related protein [Pseudoalteromonas tunicata]MDP4982463.1 asparagine synthetase B family protein [Pseudoalteromonas tunicata]
MPGLIGFIGDKHLLMPQAQSFLEVSGERCSYWQVSKCQFELKSIKRGVAQQSFETQRLKIDIWGDLFSFANQPCDDWFSLIENHFLAGTLASCLAQINGYFVLSILDKESNVLSLCSDRYGLKPLYLWQESGCMIGFASEIKALLLHPSFKQTVNSDVINSFIDVGHFIGLDTVFYNVSRMPPASILSINLEQADFAFEQYWAWSKILPNKQIKFSDAVMQLNHLFEQAVARCLDTMQQSTLAITLSGGLDSRALLAAAQKLFEGKIVTYTFGDQGCDDAVIAAKVASVAGVENHFTAISSETWFNGREQGVWLTDGLKNILHMHALSSLPAISAHTNYLLNGYLGDVTAGGSYLLPEAQSGAALFDCAKARYGKHAASALFNNDYLVSPSSDPLFIYNRGVRFISIGSDLLSHQLNNFKPFLDNDLVEFLYSLPESYRRDGRIYHHMLLQFYPQYFKDIPWQQTGRPISTKSNSVAPNQHKVRAKLVNWIKGSSFELLARKFYRVFIKKRHYVAYDEWLRQPEFKKYSYELLLSKDTMLVEYFGREKIKALLNEFYDGSMQLPTETLGGLITLELYFQQIKIHRAAHE